MSLNHSTEGTAPECFANTGNVRWSQERRDAFIAASKAGKSRVELMAMFGISRTRVSEWISRLGLATRGKQWTPEAVAVSRAMWEGGTSAEAIAATLGGGFNRHMIIGKMHRLGVTHPSIINRPPPKLRSRPRRRIPSNSRATNNGNVLFFRRMVTKPPSPEEIAAADWSIPENQRCTLMGLGRTTCRWPVGTVGTPEFFFCGATVSGTVYCERHRAAAYSYGRDDLERLVRLG